MKNKLIILLTVMAVFLVGCGQKEEVKSGKLQIVATTTMLADMATIMGGDKVEVEGLMGPGIDPHLYKASAGNVKALNEADMVVYGGLHLEGKMGEIFENLQKTEKIIVCISDNIPEEKLLGFGDQGVHDPHIWFDVMLWKEASKNLLDGFIKLDPDNKEYYTKNYEDYAKELDELDAYVRENLNKVKESSRVLVTAHDAFSYFGRAYGYEVVGLQGISTESEAGTKDVKELADFIVEREIKAVFVESSVPRKNIEALQEAVASRGYTVEIGGELFSDSLGDPGTPEGTYIGTVKANVNTIVNALK